MNKKTILMIIIVLLGIVAVSGCIGSSDTPNNNSEKNTTTTDDNNVSEEKSTTNSMSPEEKFIKTYDTNGDNLLDANEFPQSKFSQINNGDRQDMIDAGAGDYFDPYPSIQYLIDDYDTNNDKKLSADELKNIKNLNL